MRREPAQGGGFLLQGNGNSMATNDNVLFDRSLQCFWCLQTDS